MKEIIIVVAMAMMPGEKEQDMYAFTGYPFPDMVTCIAFSKMNMDLIQIIASGKYDGRPIEQVYCAPSESVMEMMYGESI